MYSSESILYILLEERVPGIQVEVRAAENHELAAIEHAFPFSPADKHAERLLRQSSGDVFYLIAWYEGEPVGHALLKWQGATEAHIAAFFNGHCPDVEDLFVAETMRSKSVGKQILRKAERLVQQRGYKIIGLSVGVENTRAKLLYTRLGYKDSPLGEHCERGEYVDDLGQLQTWEEWCIYLTKPL